MVSENKDQTLTLNMVSFQSRWRNDRLKTKTVNLSQSLHFKKKQKLDSCLVCSLRFQTFVLFRINQTLMNCRGNVFFKFPHGSRCCFFWVCKLTYMLCFGWQHTKVICNILHSMMGFFHNNFYAVYSLNILPSAKKALRHIWCYNWSAYLKYQSKYGN